MPTKRREGKMMEQEDLPVIQKTTDERFVRINERCFARNDKGLLMPISIAEFNEKIKGQAMITWDMFS